MDQARTLFEQFAMDNQLNYKSPAAWYELNPGTLWEHPVCLYKGKREEGKEELRREEEGEIESDMLIF